MQLNIPEVVALTVAVSQWVKTKLNLVGTAAEIISALVGVLLGSGYQYSLGTPVDFAGWFSVLVVGVGVAVSASGLYKVASVLALKVNSNKG